MTTPSEREEAQAKRLAADPEDIADVAPAHPPHELLGERAMLSRAPSTVRWMPDGHTLLISAHVAAASGRVRADLLAWDTEGGMRRITRGADVRSATPFPDGERALAVRSRWGVTEIVEVALSTGEVTSWTTPDVRTVVAEPVVSPQGARAAWLEQAGGGWAAVIRDLASGEDTRVTPEGGLSQLAWSVDGEALIGAVGIEGFTEIREVWRADGEPTRTWTRSGGLALAPVPAPDNLLYFLAWDDDGHDLHRVAIEPSPPTATPEVDSPIVNGAPATSPAEPVRTSVSPGRYGLGPTLVAPVGGGGSAGREGQVELGVRFGDLAGRSEHMVIGSWGSDGGARGGLVSTAWRVLPVELRLEAFAARVAFGRDIRAGGLLGFSARRGGRPTELELDLGVLVDSPLAGDLEPDRRFAYLSAAAGQRDEARGLWGLGLRGRAQAGQTGPDGWLRGEGTVAGRVGRQAVFEGRYHVGWTDAVAELDRYRLGGISTSIVPEPWLWSRITDGAFPIAGWSGSLRDEARVGLGSPAAQLYGVRHRLGDAALSERGASAVGLRVSSDTRRDPFLGTTGLAAELGLACRIEDPFSGWATRPCRSTDDYALWASIRVRR